MKSSGRSLFILALTFLIVALIWFFYDKNTTVGIIWLAASVAELGAGAAARKKEKASERDTDGEPKDSR